jgi:cell division protein FtsI/penicillin-binding protein 2
MGRATSVADGSVRLGNMLGVGELVRIEYTLNEALTEEIFAIFRRGRVERGQAIVLDPRSGRLLAYVSTDPEGLPPERTYPAASIVKLLTAATLLQQAPLETERACVYRGNKYRLSPSRLAIPKSGHETTLARALASSNNQCFSQWAVHSLGQDKLLATFERFGWLAAAAPGHDAGRIDEIKTKLDLGRLGSGLGGIRVNPLHVASLASILTDGRWVEPWWIDRVVDSKGRSIPMPRWSAPRQVLSRKIADRLRQMMVGTTVSGTAKSAFRTRRGRRMLGDVAVAGKTGNVTGTDPYGRYEWFLGLAPAEDPTIAVVVLQLQSNLWWSRSSELAAKVLRAVFCDDQGCRNSLSDRLTGDLSAWTDPLLISELQRPLFMSRAN